MGNSSSKFGASSTAMEVAASHNLSGRNAIVTGGNTGIGRETAYALARQGARVIIACRSVDRGQGAVKSILEDVQKAAARSPKPAATPAAACAPGDGTASGPPTPGTVEFMRLDLADLRSVREFATAFNGMGIPLHLLILNAGIMALPEFRETAQGYEMQWGVNHLGHFYLTQLLLEPLQRAAPSRVVVVSSVAHERSWRVHGKRVPPPREEYSAWKAYGLSKMSNILFSNSLNRRLVGTGVSAYSLHPGVIKTELHRNNGMASFFYNIGSIFMKSVPQGAATTLYCAVEAPDQPTATFNADDAIASPPAGVALPRPDGPGGKFALLEAVLPPDRLPGFTNYFADCQPKAPVGQGNDKDAADFLWGVSARLVAEFEAANPVGGPTSGAGEASGGGAAGGAGGAGGAVGAGAGGHDPSVGEEGDDNREEKSSATEEKGSVSAGAGADGASTVEEDQSAEASASADTGSKPALSDTTGDSSAASRL